MNVPPHLPDTGTPHFLALYDTMYHNISQVQALCPSRKTSLSRAKCPSLSVSHAYLCLPVILLIDTMSRRLRQFSVREALDLTFEPDEEDVPEIEEDVSEIEDNSDPDYEPDQQSTDQEEAPEGEEAEEEAPEGEEAEEEAPEGEEPQGEEPEVTFQSKNGNLLWHSSPQERGGRVREENIVRMTPGPTRYAISRVDEIKSSFQLFLPESIERIVLDMTNLEGRRVFGDTWKELDQADLLNSMGSPVGPDHTVVH